MSRAHVGESGQLLHMDKHDTDEDSIHSFASSSTLTPPPLSPASEKGFDVSNPILSRDSTEDFQGYNSSAPFFTNQRPRHPPSWRKTPLTTRGLFGLFLRLASPLFPSFLQPIDPSSPNKKRKIHPTSYLDGLRGVAALTVFSSHFTLHWFYSLRSGYLASERDTNVLQLPILRLIFAGRAAVAIFFVISGFALSYKPLVLIGKGRKDEARAVLASSVFRRWVRLFVPIVAGTGIAMVLAWKGAFMNVPNRGELIPPTIESLGGQVAHWVGQLKGFVFPFAKGDRGTIVYNGHLWTIPVEWEGSFVIFCCMLGLSNVRKRYRVAGLMGLGIWALREGRWEVACFLGGVVVAEWSLKGADEGGLVMHRAYAEFGEKSFARGGDTPAILRIAVKSLKVLQRGCKPGMRTLGALKGPLNILILFIALFFLSYAGESPSPGVYHAFLIPLTPDIWGQIWLGQEHFWLALGSLLLVFALSNSTTLQKPFCTKFAQYLGDISYSLYIVHGMVLFTLGTHLQQRWTGQVGKNEWVDNGAGELIEVIVTGKVGATTYAMAFVACGVINAVVVFWAADAFWRVVDRRSVGWGRWIEEFVSERSGR